MQVILPDEQVHQIQRLVAKLIHQEIENQITSRNLDSPYLNKKQTCEYLGISNNTLDNWIQKGLPTIRIDKTVRFNKNEINCWLSNIKEREGQQCTKHYLKDFPQKN
ncbi:TPA: helix-turn-helix domain-containing protein [Streptococcus suis]|nr:helix-turn-helix domain-containing protein [Streptococcus suis]